MGRLIYWAPASLHCHYGDNGSHVANAQRLNCARRLPERDRARRAFEIGGRA